MGTRETLVDVAARLVDEGGPDAVTLREVGRRAGVSHNAPYKHFADKQALLAAVAARELAVRLPADDLRGMLRGYVRWALAHPARFKLVFGPWTSASAELATAAEAGQALLVELVVAAQRAGELPADEPARLAALVRSLAHGAVDLALAGHLSAAGKGGVDPDQLVDDLLGHLGMAARRPVPSA